VEHEEDFRRFYEAAFGRIAGQLFLVTGDLQDAEDLTQEAFARASVRWSRLRTYDLPEAWVRRVAMRLATDRFRRARRRCAGWTPSHGCRRCRWRRWRWRRSCGPCRLPGARRSCCTTWPACRSRRRPDAGGAGRDGEDLAGAGSAGAGRTARGAARSGAP
jgi:Sigma-70 region 2